MYTYCMMLPIVGYTHTHTDIILVQRSSLGLYISLDSAFCQSTSYCCTIRRIYCLHAICLACIALDFSNSAYTGVRRQIASQKFSVAQRTYTIDTTDIYTRVCTFFFIRDRNKASVATICTYRPKHYRSWCLQSATCCSRPLSTHAATNPTPTTNSHALTPSENDVKIYQISLVHT